MTLDQQRKAFDHDLHALVDRYFDEFDLPAEDILELMVREEMFLICMAVAAAQDDDEPTGDWGLNGDGYED